ncbi:MAG TPA: type II toxin-antitoxin system RelE/ParE family toxin [Candidatus Nanoarchaeia archaeon]|nr:type II toxin-antitoxin system RelE/ParE family toxin [Candidatus Nanoarchaeia archaeon]
MYEIIFTEEAKQQLRKLDKRAQERIGAAIERIKVRPYNFVRRLYNSKYYRLRVDHYRLILDIQDLKLIIYVIKVGHRGDVYKK